MSPFAGQGLTSLITGVAIAIIDLIKQTTDIRIKIVEVTITDLSHWRITFAFGSLSWH